MQCSTGFFSFVFEDRTFIAATPERAFAFFEAMDVNYRIWHPDHLGFEWREGHGLSIGNVCWFSEIINGKRLDKLVRIIDVAPQRYIAFEPVNWLMRVFLRRISFGFQPKPGGFIFEAQIEMHGIGPAGRWLNRKEFAAVERHMVEEGENLKTLLEGGASKAR